MLYRTRLLASFLLAVALFWPAPADAQSWFRQRTYKGQTAPVQPASTAERRAVDALLTRYALKAPDITDDTYAAPGLPLSIPDDGPAVWSKVDVPAGEAVAGLSVSLDITHQARGDLRVRLYSPGGEMYTLADEDGGSADDLRLTRLTIAIPAEGTIHGTWKLSVQDRDNRNVGTLVGWSMHVSRITSAVIDLTMSLESTPDADTRSAPTSASSGTLPTPCTR